MLRGLCFNKRYFSNLATSSHARLLSSLPSLELDEPKKTWFKDGINFKCTMCGKCCTGDGGFVWVNEQEILALSKHFKLSYQEFGKQYLKHDKVSGRLSLKSKFTRQGEKEIESCILLDGKTCTAYNARPTQCHTYPFWPQFLESKEAGKECEGLNQPQDEENRVSEHKIMTSKMIQEIHNIGENYTYDELSQVAQDLEKETA